jgi:hypothetical protein
MDRNTRLNRIDELQAQIAEGRQRIADDAAMRDDAAELEAAIAEHRSEPVASPPVRETDPTGIVYRRYEGNAATAAAEAANLSTGWDEWLSKGFAAHTEAERRVTGEAIGEVVYLVKQELLKELAERDRKIASLKAENVEVKGLLGAAVKELADIRARLVGEHERVSELKADVKAELQILGHTDNELMQRFTALAQHL